MGILSENSLVGASFVSPEHYDYKIDNSLKFNDDDSAYLSWTPSSAGNRKTWTWSGWVKRTAMAYQFGDYQEPALFTWDSDGSHASSNYLSLHWNQSDGLTLFDYTAGYNLNFVTTAIYRDPLAWMHVLAVMDTTQATSSDRVKLYVNGERITSFTTESYPSQNLDTRVNTASGALVDCGRRASGYFDGYLAEVNFIDGQALTPSDFGEADADYGDWKPKAYTGTHGTNGFYLPFKQDATVEGFSAVAYTGDGTTSHLIQGVGYQPDMVWIKTRTNQADSHYLADAVRGGSYHLRPESGAWGDLGSSTTFDPDGFTLGQNDGQSNSSSNTYIAWTWDMGGTTVSNTNGSITSSARASSTYGQSITTYTGNGTAGATIGHGLSSAPEMVWVKSRSGASDFRVGTTVVTGKAMADGNGYYTELNSNGGLGNPGSTGGTWNETNPTSTVVTMGNNGSHNGSGSNYVMYCFHSVTGYSKIGTYTGDATTNGSLSVTTGFRPAFLMVKKTNGLGNWIMVDSARNVDPNNINKYLKVNTTDVDATSLLFKFTSTGFTIHANLADINSSGGEYIYMAFADTKEYSFFTDQSTNSNHWTPNNISSVADVMLDSPTNNFATFSPIDHATSNAPALSEGNLKVVNDANDTVRGTLGATSGKWYAEFIPRTAVAAGTPIMFGLMGMNGSVQHENMDRAAYIYSDNAASHGIHWNEGQGSNGTANTITDLVNISVNDVLQLAWDVDTGKIWVGRNNTWLSSGNPSAGTTPAYTMGTSGNNAITIGADHAGVAYTMVANCGQDSSFAGNKTAQGNQDSNSIGDFYYAPPSGFLALCSANLPDPTVIPSEHFNTVLYTGDGTTSNAITGVGFQPDWVWTKHRNHTTAHQHNLFDVVRGVNKTIHSQSSEIEETITHGLSSFDSDGFTIGNNAAMNDNNFNYVAWNWKAGGAAVSNTNGTITSSVSANVDAGFSIMTYTGTGSSYKTIGHGLSKAPEMWAVKARTDVSDNQWFVCHTGFASDYYTDFIHFDTSGSVQDSAARWGDTAPTSSVITIGNTSTNESGDYICYAWHSVDGYSKVGSYTGNGSATDGTFVYLGFKPAYVMIKSVDFADIWGIYDNDRSTYNVVDDFLMAHSTTAEQTNDANVKLDFLSNGFKARGNNDAVNKSGGTLLYIAFAEMPSRWARGR